MTLAFLIVFAWIFFGYICSRIAKYKGRNPTTWFYLGFFLGILGVVIVAILPSRHFQKLSYNPAPLHDSLRESDEPALPIGPDPIYEEIRKKNWYYLDSHQTQFGPMSFEAFKIAFIEGRITLASYVWNEEMADWKKLQDLPQYHRFFNINLQTS